MDVTKWEDTWGTIDWKNDSENEIKKKIIEFYHAGVDFNMIDKNGNRPLNLAAASSTVGVIDLLIDGGADITLTNRNSQTPLFGAATFGKTENVKYIIERGPSNRVKFVNMKDNNGDTALHEVAHRGYPATTRVLIEHGADVNIKNKRGGTALHEVAHRGYPATTRVLIEAGADVNIKDNWGKTALNWAKNKEIKELIQNADKIRAEYLKNHPESSLQQTLGDASQKPNKMSLIKNPKTR